MLKSKSFLCLDFGAGTVKAAEFEPNEAGTLVLKRYGVKALGMAGAQDAAREAALKKAIQELIAEKGLGSKVANVCAPGFHVFSKFVKLPPVDTSKVTQIIQYEAQQNVPFPLEEVVWDFQILGTTATNELEVLLVAIKSEVVEGLFRTADASGLRLQLVDVSPASLCNAFRFNYGDLEGCTMLLDIGAKTSNLLFFEKGKVYARGINIGANSITQEFAAEAKLRLADAEQIKVAEGFVSLGGAYEEPENPHQAAISKIARQVMTRLHIQVNQTIQFYRGQQGGSAPQRLFLAGGASIMPYTAQFFAEKLSVEVEYFNPFRNIQIDPSINLEELAGVAHSFGEVVGLGLRSIAQCPVELNLVPKSIRTRQKFDQKKPYFIAAIFSLVLVVWAYGWFYGKVAAVKASALAKISEQVVPLQQAEQELKGNEAKIRNGRAQVETYTELARTQYYWPELLTELRQVLIRTENEMRQPGTDVGVWIETLGAVGLGTGGLLLSSYSGAQDTMQQSFMPYMMDPRMLERYFGIKVAPSSTFVDPSLRGQEGQVPAEEKSEIDAPKPAAAPKDPSQNIDKIEVRFRAVNLNRTGNDPSANSRLAYAVQDQLWASSLFDKDGTKLSKIDPMTDENPTTFTFGVTLKVKNPLPN